MTIKAKAILFTVLIAILSFAGLGAASTVMQHDQHAAMMDQGSTACVAHCLNASNIPSSIPLAPTAVLAFASAPIVATTVSLPAFSPVTTAPYQALTRPSPNLIALYAHYLD